MWIRLLRVSREGTLIRVILRRAGIVARLRYGRGVRRARVVLHRMEERPSKECHLGVHNSRTWRSGREMSHRRRTHRMSLPETLISAQSRALQIHSTLHGQVRVRECILSHAKCHQRLMGITRKVTAMDCGLQHLLQQGSESRVDRTATLPNLQVHRLAEDLVAGRECTVRRCLDNLGTEAQVRRTYTITLPDADQVLCEGLLLQVRLLEQSHSLPCQICLPATSRIYSI